MIEHKTDTDILIVDDKPENLRLLSGILKAQGYEVRLLRKGNMVMSSVLNSPPDLILLDIMMPDIDGYEICRQLKADEKSCKIPIIFISALSEVVDKIKAFCVGGVDYIGKPFNTEEVLARVRTHLTISHLQQQVSARNEQLQREIAEHQKTSAALREREEKLVNANMFLDKIINAIPNPVFVKDEQHRWLILNDTFCDFMGYRREQLIGKSDYDFFPKEQADVFWEKDNLVFESETVHSNEESLTDAEGKLRTILTKKSAMTDINGQKILVGIITDITDRKNMEDALRESEEQYRDLVQNANNVILRANPQWEFIFLNRYGQEFFGYTEDEIIGKNLFGTIVPDSESVTGRDLNDLLFEIVRNPDKYRYNENENMRKNGERVWLAWTNKVTTDSEGNPKEILCIANDITEKKQAEKALLESEEQYRNLVENMSDIVYILDTAGKVIYASPAVESIAGFKPEEIIGRHMTEFVHPDDLPILYKQFQTVKSGRKTSILEYRLYKKSGEPFWARISSRPNFKDGVVESIQGILTDISERKQAEEALKRSNSVLKAQQEASVDGILTVNENKKITDYNQKFIELWNIPDNIVRSKDDKELLKSMLSVIKSPDKFMEKLRYLYENILDIGQGEIETTDGRTCDWYCAPILSSENQYLGKIWFFRDITDRKRTEQALLDGEEKYRNLVENINDVVYILDPKGFFIYISPIIESVIGFSPEEVVGRHVSEFIYHEDLPILNDQFKRLLSKQKAPILEYRFSKKSGEVCWGRTSNRPKFKDGAVESVHGIFTDITERKRVEESLQRSEALLRDTGRMAKIGGWEFYVETQKLNWTEEVFKIHEVDVDYEPTVSKAIEFYVPESRAIIQKAVQRTIESGEPYDLELRFITAKGNPLWVHSIGKAFQQNGKTIRIFGTFQDITDRKRVEEELLKAKEAAETANRFKSDFLSNMSHEIRTPMNAIMGFTELLASLIEDRQQKSYLEAIQSGGKSLLTLINDILDLSKIEAGKLDIRYEPVNPHDIFYEIRQIFAMKISQKNLEFITVIAEDIPESLMLDEVRLRQVLFNLIGNAIKFTESGYVKISAEPFPRPLPGAERGDSPFPFREGGRGVRSVNLTITVEDTGIGVPAESQAKIFEAFMQQEGQSAKKYGGTGLGLAITRRLVEMMNGEIVLESEAGRGSIFRITLHNVAISRTASEIGEPKLTDPENLIFIPATILVADDLNVNRFLIKALFKNTDIRIIEAEDGRDAISVAELNLPDAILMDISMPMMDGYEATRQIKQSAALKHIPVIALTARAMTQEKEKIMSAGFDGYLTKPVQRAELFCELSRFIKNSATCNVQRAKNNEKCLCPKTIGKLPEITEQLENEFAPLYKKALESGNFADIEEFANRIRAFGEQYSLENFIALGQDLLIHVGNFDIDNIEAALNSYPKLIEKIKYI